MIREDELLKDAFLDLLVQHCGVWEQDKDGLNQFKGYDSKCLSANENALDLAVERGWISAEAVLR